MLCEPATSGFRSRPAPSRPPAPPAGCNAWPSRATVTVVRDDGSHVAGRSLQRRLRIGTQALVVAGVVALRPEIATGTASSVRSLLRVLGLIAGWVLLTWLARRHVRQRVLRMAVVGVAGASVLSLTVLPYFRTEHVDDPLGAVAGSPAPPALGSPSPAPSPSAPATTPSVPSGPQRLGSGPIRGLAGHRGSGQGALYRLDDGRLLVRLEDFDVSHVPSPVVYLVPGVERRRPGGVKLGGLRGSEGNQNFAVPVGADVSGPQTILVWCEAFAVPVAAATATA